LNGFPEFESDEAAKKCKLFLNHNPLTSLKGAPKFVSGLVIKDCAKLTSLEGCPEIMDGITLDDCIGLRDLVGLKGKNNISIYAEGSGLTSLKGCPDEVRELNIVNCDNLKDLSEFPKHVFYAYITIFPGCLIDLHEKVHNHRIRQLRLNRYSIITEMIYRLEDPFEFQDWCIENRIRGVPMKLQNLFESTKDQPFDEKYTREDNPETFECAESFMKKPNHLYSVSSNALSFSKAFDFGKYKAPKKVEFTEVDDPDLCIVIKNNPTIHSLDVIPKVICDNSESFPVLTISGCKNITSLKGADNAIEFLDANGTGLTSLLGCPGSIESLYVDSTQITSFEGVPGTIERNHICLFMQKTDIIERSTNVSSVIYI
jgi:hypothetical protein